MDGDCIVNQYDATFMRPKTISVLVTFFMAHPESASMARRLVELHHCMSVNAAIPPSSRTLKVSSDAGIDTSLGEAGAHISLFRHLRELASKNDG